MFDDGETGSGQIDVESVKVAFPEIEPSDITVLKKLADIKSYDVFGLRVLLRQLGIEVDEHEYLQLSDVKQTELSDYMKVFTQRLIVEVYSNDDEIRDYADVTGLFQNPDVAAARQKLSRMADTMGISLDNIPRFLEDYGDIYLSVAYFRQCMDQVEPILNDFDGSVNEILAHQQLRHDQSLVKICKLLQNKFMKLNAVVADRFELFSKSTDQMWDGINAQRFGAFKKLVEDNHTALGSLLCCLNVKMTAWAQRFPQASSGGPVKRAEFIISDMRVGL